MEGVASICLGLAGGAIICGISLSIHNRHRRRWARQRAIAALAAATAGSRSGGGGPSADPSTYETPFFRPCPSNPGRGALSYGGYPSAVLSRLLNSSPIAFFR